MQKVSVIIPVYNGEKYLLDCYDSIRSQTLTDLEIIFVNDGSVDGSLSVINKIAEKDSFVKVISQENAGPGAARNAGIQAAAGEYIAFLDCDDRFYSNEVLKILYNKAKENSALICGGSWGSDTGVRASERDKWMFDKEGYVDYCDYQFDFGFSRFIYSTRFLQENKIEFPLRRVYEDPVFFVKAMDKAGRFYAVKDMIYIYSGSHHNVLSSEQMMSFIANIKEILLISSDKKYSSLHTETYKRLVFNTNNYLESNPKSFDNTVIFAFMDAYGAINKELLEEAGYKLSIPPFLEVICNSCKKYMKMRNNFLVRPFVKMKKKK